MTVTLIVEVGNADPTANAYVSLANALAYHTNQGNTFWVSGTIGSVAITDDQRSSAIIRATSFVEMRFKRRYRGLRQTVEQALGWPRIGAFDDDNFTIFGVPYQIMNAVNEYALRALWYQSLAPDPMRTVPVQDFSQTSNPGQQDLILGPVRTKTERIGPLEERTSYDGLAQRALQDERTTRAAQSGVVNDYFIPEYPAADLWMEQIIRNPSSGTRLVRGS